MKLSTERKVKFWLATVTKVAVLVWVVFKVYEVIVSKTIDNVPTEASKGPLISDGIDKPDDTAQEPTTEEGSHSMTATTGSTEKNEEPVNILPNTISIVIYDATGIDLQLADHLEKTLFQNYEVRAPGETALQKKSDVLLGHFRNLGKVRPQLIASGEVTYSYKKSSLSTKTISCQVNLRMNTYDLSKNTKLTHLSKSILATGIGFTEEEAKTNAIKKI